MIIKQGDLVVLIQKTINKQSRFKINKRTTREELVNEAYIYVMEHKHLLDKFKNDPAHERAYIVSMVRTSIVKFYIALDVIKLPPIKQRNEKAANIKVIDTVKEGWESSIKMAQSEYREYIKTADSQYKKREKEVETEFWGDFFDEAFDSLTNVETYILENRYYYAVDKQRKTLEELATDLHISRVRVFQLEEQALDKLFNYYLHNKNPDENKSFQPNLIK